MSFLRWLESQRARTDAIGDVASFILAAGDFPRSHAGHARWKKYLKDKQADPAHFAALESAWKEYGGGESALAFRKKTIKPAKQSQPS